MEIYLVGGAVRDKLLGLQVQDRDWVVVGATPDAMIEQGFRPVGKDFPVFLHPQTHEEYALARTERKVAPGYTGFTFNAAPDVTLEEDLQRRDLTINAMAETPDGRLIDPYGGADDLRDGILRHVSPAFAEDPVRILRVARFAARYAKWGFRVAHGTNKLMRQMVENGEVDALVAERVWAEMERALGEDRPSQFFRVLRRCGALARIFPEIDVLYGVPQPQAHHPEVDTGVHAMLVLDMAARLTPDTRVRFAALLHDLGKGESSPDDWPRHIGHEQDGVAIIREFCQRLRVPNEYRDLAIISSRFHTHCHRLFELRPGTVLEMFAGMDAFRKPKRVDQFALACEADSRGREGHADDAYPQGELLRRAFAAARDVDTKTISGSSANGEAIKEAIRQARIGAIKDVLARTRD
jgi:tRNA nucleotidyltransferase (CCA-adding enzyme)